MKFNRYAFALACATIVQHSSSSCNIDPFASMEKSMKIMEEQMQEMFNSMQNMHQAFHTEAKKELANQTDQGINVGIDQTDDNTVKVTISGIQADQFEAVFSDKELTIKAQTATVQIAYHHSLLSASVNQEIKQEIVGGKNKEKTSQQLFTASSFVSQLIAKPIDLENAGIEFNKESKTLTVSLPAKEQVKATKSIPVNVK